MQFNVESATKPRHSASSPLPHRPSPLSPPSSTPEPLHLFFFARQRSHTGSLCAHGVPDIAVEVVVSGQQESARLAEGDAGDAADDVVVRVHGQFLVGADVKQPTGGVVRAGGERVTAGEELQRGGGGGGGREVSAFQCRDQAPEEKQLSWSLTGIFRGLLTIK